jgi:hypothetical protein
MAIAKGNVAANQKDKYLYSECSNLYGKTAENFFWKVISDSATRKG